MKCPKCGSLNPVKYGSRKPGLQRYKCPDCNRFFQDNSSDERISNPDTKHGRFCLKCKTYKPYSEFNKRKRLSKNKKVLYVSYCKDCVSDMGRERKYGMESDSYRLILENQNNRCAICGIEFSKSKPRVDHNHVTGAVRGILCDSCNHGLGNFKDNKLLLHNAIKYLSENLEM